MKRSEPGDHSGVGGTSHGADDDGVEEDIELLLLLGDLESPVCESEATELVLRCAGRDAVGLASGLLDLAHRVLPGRSDADVEACWVEPDIGAHYAGQENVADLVIDRVVPVNPLLLDEAALEAELCGHGCDLPGVVGLDAADRHERIGALRQHIRDDVLELSRFVTAEREAAVAVLALGPQGGASEMPGQAVERMNGARPERERVAGEFL